MSYISYPFTLDTIGVVNTTDNPAKIYEDRLLTLLSTNVGQRPMNPGYGVDFSQAFFENEFIVSGGNRTTYKKAIDEAIRSATERWLPDIKIHDIVVSNPNDSGQSDVSILITVPGDISTSLNVTTAIFMNDGTVTRL